MLQGKLNKCFEHGSAFLFLNSFQIDTNKKINTSVKYANDAKKQLFNIIHRHFSQMTLAIFAAIDHHVARLPSCMDQTSAKTSEEEKIIISREKRRCRRNLAN